MPWLYATLLKSGQFASASKGQLPQSPSKSQLRILDIWGTHSMTAASPAGLPRRLQGKSSTPASPVDSCSDLSTRPSSYPIPSPATYFWILHSLKSSPLSSSTKQSSGHERLPMQESKILSLLVPRSLLLLLHCISPLLGFFIVIACIAIISSLHSVSYGVGMSTC